ncbi:MAG: malate dehydrogenase (quinone) [Oleiphilaceae bacterium]|nr:malate dehydrogenase (quinone) [Oleiphilaceae bacterium]
MATNEETDVLLVGGGVMSTTLGIMLKLLAPEMKITQVERLDHVAHESTDGWNNAGTGHAGYCELNYTPDESGEINIQRALEINQSFEVSLQLWSHLVEQGILPSPDRFINATPHQSFVWGERDVDFLRRRHAALNRHHLFRDMKFTDDPRVLEDWMPLVVQGRDPMQPVAATRVSYGADVDFGSLTRHMVHWLEQQPDYELMVSNEVRSLKKKEGVWNVTMRHRHNGDERTLRANFVFLGAGGGALPLLQKSNITESHGYGGFPVSGQWLVCERPDLAKQHHSKVYGKAPLGAPPMSVPHLDTRIINGESALLFGPFAGFTTKFLKEGSYFDLFSSIRSNNLRPMMSAGISNMELTRYLIGEVFQSPQARMQAVRNFYPDAKDGDWRLQQAGKRVQIIKKNAQGRGKLEFGTEVVAARDGSLAALLGASPGASTAAHAMIDVIKRCFPERMAGNEWPERLKAMIPSFGESLIDDEALLRRVRERNLRVLKLDDED